MTMENIRGQKHAEIVARIINLLQNKGPTLPIHISTETGVSMLFASAFLSELMAKKSVRVSHMKIGSSPLYYLPGQEEQLLKFVEGFPYLLGGAPVLQECNVSLSQQNPGGAGSVGGNLIANCKGVLYSFLGAPRPVTKMPAVTPKAMGR